MFDEKRADYVCAFLELLAFGSGDWAGKPFRLQDWQREPIREFYGKFGEKLPAKLAAELDRLESSLK